jgi:hypothetical protein
MAYMRSSDGDLQPRQRGSGWPAPRDPGGILYNGLVLALAALVGAALERWLA